MSVVVSWLLRFLAIEMQGSATDKQFKMITMELI